MRFVTYRSTPGLEQFPSAERFRVWRAADARLMREDPEFRARMKRSQRSILRAAALLVLPASPLPFLLGRGPWATALGAAVLLLGVAAYTVRVLRASFALQAYKNERIGRRLAVHSA
jgi:hypothetical protein